MIEEQAQRAPEATMKDAEDNDRHDQQLKRQTDRGARKTAAKRNTGRGGRRGARRHHGAHGHVPELAGGPDLSRARRGQLLASRLRDDILLGCFIPLWHNATLRSMLQGDTRNVPSLVTGPLRGFAKRHGSGPASSQP